MTDPSPADFGLASAGALLGVSQIIHGAYDEATWSVIAIGVLALVLACMVGAPRRPPMAALLPLIGLWLWSLVSAGWSDSTDAAHTAANRWLLYAAALALLWWAVGNDRRRATALLFGASAGVLGVAGWMLAQMLAGQGPSLFLYTRLNDPLGYINGQAGYLLVAVWPCLALAERRGSKPAAALAGIGLGGVVVLVGLGLLTQSRSWGIGLIVSALLVLAAIPGRRRRFAALALTGVVVAALYAPLAAVWRHPGASGAATAATTRHAAAMILAGAGVAAVLWAIAVLAFERLAPDGSVTRRRALSLTRVALICVGIAAIAAVAINAGRIADHVQSQWHAFVHLGPEPTGTRFLSLGGNRYDYWRVALLEFRSEPITGVGAGNYDPGYYLHRRTDEAITNPHSLELQTLAELGLVGVVLLAAFLAAVALGFHRTARAAAASAPARLVAVAAGGAFAGWLVQTSVDWMHLIPGLTGIALAAAVALLVRPTARVAALSGRARITAIAVTTVIAAVGAFTIAPRVLSLRAQQSAQAALGHDAPRVAITDATRALDYDPYSVQALVLRAAGFARLHAFSPARDDLVHAVALEPRNWVTWALLGDLLTRRGDRRQARAAYERVVTLDPIDGPSLLSALAADGRAA